LKKQNNKVVKNNFKELIKMEVNCIIINMCRKIITFNKYK